MYVYIYICKHTCTYIYYRGVLKWGCPKIIQTIRPS